MKILKNIIYAFKETAEVMGGWVVTFWVHYFKASPKANVEIHKPSNLNSEQNRTQGLGEAGYQHSVVNNTCSAQHRNHNGRY